MSARRNTCTAVLFLAGICGAVLSLCLGVLPQASSFIETEKQPRRAPRVENTLPRDTLPPLQGHLSPSLPDLSGVGEDLAQLTQTAEADVNDLLDREHLFIQIYGGAQRLMGRRVVEDPDPQYSVVKLTDGILTFANLDAQPVDMTVRAQEMADFARRVEEEYDVPLLYVQAPSKLDVLELPDGINDYADVEADQFLSLLDKEGIDTLDLRDTFRRKASLDEDAAQELFFRTDHHWTPAGAFLGYQQLCEKLKEHYHYIISDTFTDPDSYSKVTFEDVFLGSQGKRVGSLYAGLDDLEIWYPKFQTDFTYSVPAEDITRKGTFPVSLLFPERLAQVDLYEDNLYAVYAGDDYLLSRAVNHRLPGCPRVLILRDSFGCAFTPFLSLITSEVDAIDPRNFNGDQDTMMEFIDWLEPDLIIVMNTSSSLRVDQLYPYLPTARADYLASRAEQENTDG